MATRFYIPLLTCTFSILTVLTTVYADEPTPTDVSTINTPTDDLIITGDWHGIGGETGTYGLVNGLDFNDANAKFDLGAVISVTGTDNSVNITDSTLQLAWSGKKLEEQGEDETDEAFDDRKNAYLLSDNGGFGGRENPLDVLVNNSIISFNIQEETEPDAWYIDSYNIHIADGGAEANIENGTVAARTIDDMVSVPVEDGETKVPSGGTFTKTGAGTLIIGGAHHDADDGNPESGLNISGTLNITKGTVNLAGDRELAAGDPNGNATTAHQVKNVTIAGGSVLDVSTGGTLKLTNEDESVDDITIAENGKLRIASSENTGIYNTEKNTNIAVDGGIVEIYADESTNSTNALNAEAVDAKLGEKGGTIDVDGGVTFENRSVTGTGNYTKTGEGTHIINQFGIEGDIVVTEGTSRLASGDHQAGRMIIGGSENEVEAVLELNGGAWVQLTNSPAEDVTDIAEKADIVIQEKGTLRVSSAVGTGIFKYNEDETAAFPYVDTTLLVDGGTVEITKSDTESTEPETLVANTIHSLVGAGGGTINIAENVTFESGTITAADLAATEQGSLVKTGNGTYIVGDVNLGSGAFDVQQGTAEFAGTVVIGSLKSGAGTTINMVADKVVTEPEEEVTETDVVGTPQNYEFANFEMGGTFNGGEHNVKVGSGSVTGETGQLTNIGDFTTTGTFDLGKGEHDAKRLVVASGTFDLKAGAWLELKNTNTELADMEVKGTLKIASADNTGIFKKEGEDYIDTELFVDGGTVEIYQPEGGKDYLLADTIHTELGTHGGIISVAEGLTFESGSIIGEIDPDKVTGHYTKQGKGTHVVNGMSIGGTIQIQDGKTVLKNGADDIAEHAASAVIANGATLEIAQDVSLTLADITTIKTDSVVINNGTLTTKTLDIAGGTLQLQLTPTELLDLEEGETAPPAAITTDSLSVSNGGKITVGSDQLPLGSYTYENVIEVKSEMTDQTLAELNKNQSALYRSVWGRSSSEDSTSDFLTLTMQRLTFDSYMNEIGWKQGNAAAAARLIDHVIENTLNQEEPTEASTALLARLVTLNANEVTAECRAVMAGELVSDAVRMVMSSPHRMVFQQLNSMPTYSRTANRVELGQANAHSRVRFWFNPYAQSEEGDASDQTFDGYSLTRVGFMLGGDVSVSSRVTLGLVFNYGNPNIDNDLGEVSANDMMVGGYAKMPLFWNINANAMIGYGIQQYTYEGGGRSADFDGDSIFGSVEMVRTFPMMTILKWTPVIGLDFQSIGMDDLSLKSPILGAAMPIAPEGMDSVAVRVGLRGELMRFRTRVQYIRQVSGDDYMMSSISLNNAASTSLPGVQWGKDWVNVGLGGELIQSRNFRMFADYDLDISKNTTSHLGSISAVLMW